MYQSLVDFERNMKVAGKSIDRRSYLGYPFSK